VMATERYPDPYVRSEPALAQRRDAAGIVPRWPVSCTGVAEITTLCALNLTIGPAASIPFRPPVIEAQMQLIQQVACASLPTRHGDFMMHVYDSATHREHVALTVGAIDDGAPVLVRMHSECLTGDVFGSRRCDCGEQLDDSLKVLQEKGRGVLLYLRQDGRGIGLTNKILAYAIQEQGFDTVEANLALGLPEDGRDYRDAAAILRDLGVVDVILMTNNPAKIEGLTENGIRIVRRHPVAMPPHEENIDYLRTKREKMGHLLSPGLLLPQIDDLTLSADD
jgi:GTP cyclohydrolase II